MLVSVLNGDADHLPDIGADFTVRANGEPLEIALAEDALQWALPTLLPTRTCTVRLRTYAGRYPLASRSPLARFPCPEPTVQAHTALAGISGGQRTLQALPQATFAQFFGAAMS